MTGGKIEFPARIRLQNPGAGASVFFPLVCFSRKTHQQPSAPRKLILGSIKSGPASGLFFKFSGACGGLCFFKNCRRLRRAWFFSFCRRLRRALFFQNLSAPAAGFVFIKFFRRLRRACSYLKNLSAPAAGFVCSIVSAPAAGSCFSR